MVEQRPPKPFHFPLMTALILYSMPSKHTVMILLSHPLANKKDPYIKQKL
jgi:hypothetical protein